MPGRYANTHSSGSGCGIQTTHFFHEARDIVKEEVHGTVDDVVLFAGSGCTGAVAKLAHLLGLKKRRDGGAVGTAAGGGGGGGCFACKFPGCGRKFADRGSCLLYTSPSPRD